MNNKGDNTHPCLNPHFTSNQSVSPSLVRIAAWLHNVILHQNILYPFGIQTGSHSVKGSTIYLILFSSILANTLLGCDSRLIPLY